MPSTITSVQLVAAHTPCAQNPDAQSPGTTHPWPVPHAPQVPPPQSTPVSRVFGTTCNVTEAGATTIIVGATGSLYLVLVYLAAYSLPIGDPKSIMRGSVQINALTVLQRNPCGAST